MSFPLSTCVFIRDNTAGFCLWESLASVLSFVDEVVVMDLGSTDGTRDILHDIARHNHKFTIVLKDGFPEIDAGVFATLANELIQICKHETVWYFQADEIPHENLLRRLKQRVSEGILEASFWRIQYRDNFQSVKWFPHVVHRIGQKNNFNFVGDGMNSDRLWDPPIISEYDGGFFPKWGAMGQEGIKPHVDDMILDVSLVGAFRDNIIQRRELHAPFWHEQPHIENMPADEWERKALINPDWTKTESPYDLPKIMRPLIGQTTYPIRPDLIEAIKADNTEAFVGI